MKFYLVRADISDEVLACELTMMQAVESAKGYDDDNSYTITVVECPVNAETVRRLLGGLGGYATSVRSVPLPSPRTTDAPK